MVRVGIVRVCITSSLTTCSGQGVVIQGKGNEKECVVEDIGINPHSIRRDVMSVLSSNHFFSQQLTNYPTNRLLLHPNMPMMNSHTFQSSSGLNTITRPSPRRSGGDYPSGQQVCRSKSGLLLMKTDLPRLRSMTWSSQTSP